MLVYDITSRDSFENVAKWMSQIRDKADPSIVMILIGNKSDLQEKRQVKIDEAMRFAEINCNILFYSFKI
jgi:GTPase SAR1 family protein